MTTITGSLADRTGTSDDLTRSCAPNPCSIVVKQVNLQHSKMGQIHINNWIDWNKNSRYICLVQEPYINGQILSNQPRTAMKYTGSVKNSPRTTIYTSRSIQAWFIDELSNRDATVIVVRLNRRQTLIASIYLDYNEEVVQPWLNKILDFAKHRGYAILLGLDSNCHSTLYGHETNPRGAKLEDFIAANRLLVENKGKKYTYECSTGRSIIDITLTSKLAVSVKNWRVANDEINFSDHHTIYYELETERFTPPDARRWHEMDWELFRELLMKLNIRIQAEMTTHRLEECLKQWYQQIMQVINRLCPLKKMRTKDLNNPWWTKELQTLRKELKPFYRAKIKHPTEANKEEYRKHFNIFRKKCLKAKQKDWQQFVEKTGGLDAMNTLRKILEKSNRNTLGVLVKTDGTITKPGTDTLEYLLQAHFPSLEPLAPTTHPDIKMKTAEINSTNIPGFNEGNLIEVFNGFKSKKSPGPDQLKPFILKELPKSKVTELLFIYKSMLLLKFTPTQWKESKVIWIPKAGKDDYKHYKSWRAISLSNYALKGLEKLIVKQADKDMINVNIHQHGFRRNKSTESAISETANYIERHITVGQDVLGVFLDIQAAFDTILPEAIKDALLEYNIHPLMVEWYYDYLCHRNLYTEHNGDSASATIRIGFPQGGVCSAKFWIIAFNEAINIINQYGALGIGFADDCCILLHKRKIDHAMGLLQRITNELVAWGATLGLTFNPIKTVCMLFTRSTEKTLKLPSRLLQINGTTVPISYDTRYLGVQMDNKLNWNIHFDKAVSKAKTYLVMMVSSLNKRWGPKPKLVKWLYESIVRPRLAYSCVAWAHTITQAYKLNKLEQLNRLATLMLAPVRKRTPTMAMEIINNIIPLELHLQEVGLNSFCRLKLVENTEWITKTKRTLKFTPHLYHWLKEAENALGHQCDEESIFEYTNDKNYFVAIDPVKGRSRPTLSELNVYTDGSKTSLGSGSGFVIIKGKKDILYTESINLPDNATIFQAELIAIREAATYLINTMTQKQHYIKIFCDSQAALQALAKNTCKANTVKETHHILNELAEANNKVQLQWIKAHVGHDGNELADEYAKLGTTDNSIHINTRTTRNQIRACIANYTFHKWREKWQAINKYRQTKIFYPHPDRGKYRQVKMFSRKELQLYTQAITGQNNLNYLNSIIVTGYTSMCRFCEEEDETFSHLVGECPVFHDLRVEVVGSLGRVDLSRLVPRQIMHFLEHEEIRKAFGTNVTEELVKGGQGNR